MQIHLVRHTLMLFVRNKAGLVACALLVLVSIIAVVAQLPGFLAREKMPRLNIVALIGVPTEDNLVERGFVSLTRLNPPPKEISRIMFPGRIHRYQNLDLLFHQRFASPWEFHLIRLANLYVHILLPVFGIFIGAALLSEEKRLRLSLQQLPVRPVQMIAAKIVTSLVVAAVPLAVIFALSIGVLTLTPAGIQREVVQRLGYFYLASYIYLLLFVAIGLFFTVLFANRRTALIAGIVTIVVLVVTLPAIEHIIHTWFMDQWYMMGQRAPVTPTPLLRLATNIRGVLHRHAPSSAINWISSITLNPSFSHHVYLRGMGITDVNFPIARMVGYLLRRSASLLIPVLALFSMSLIVFSVKGGGSE